MKNVWCASATILLPLSRLVASSLLLVPLASTVNAQGQELVSFRNLSAPGFDVSGDPLPDGAVIRLGSDRFQHPSSLTDMVLSPDGAVVITLGRSEIICWESGTGKELWRKAHSGVQFSSSYGQRPIVFSRKQSRHFYTPAPGGGIEKWDVQTGGSSKLDLGSGLANIGVFFGVGGPSQSRSLDVSADDGLFLLGGSGGLTCYDRSGKRIWNSANNPTKLLNVEAASRDRLAFGGEYSMGILSPDESTVSVIKSENPKQIELLDPENGQVTGTIALAANLVRMTFSPGSQHLFTTQRDCGVRCYAIDTGEQVWELALEADKNGAESYACGIACSPDAKHIAACVPIGSKYWIYMLQADTGRVSHILKGGMWKPWAVEFTADSKTLFSTGWDAAIRRWDVRTGKELPLPVGLRGSASISMSLGGALTAFVDGTGTVRVLDTESGRQIAALSEVVAGEALEFSPDARRLYIGSSTDDEIRILAWDFREDKVAHDISWPKGNDPHASVEEITTDASGRYFAAAVFRQSKAYVWDARTGVQLAGVPHRSVYGLSLSPDGKRLATAGWDKTIRLWESATGGELSQTLVQDEPFMENLGRVDMRMYSVSFSPDGRRLAACPMSGPSSIWKVGSDSSLTLETTLATAGHTFGAIDWSASGQWIASGSSSGKVEVFCARTGQRMLNVGVHSDHVYTVRFGGDRYLASGGGGFSYVWSLDGVPSATEDGAELIDLGGLWDQLRGLETQSKDASADSDQRLAMRAIFALAAAPEGTAYVENRIEEITSVVDPRKMRATRKEGTLGKVMRRKAVEDNSFEFYDVAHRALLVLKISGTQEAKRALERFTLNHPSEVIRVLAGELVEAP